MIIILYILGAFLLILASLLLLPWRFGLQAENQPALEIKAELEWAFGTFGFRASYGSGGFNSQVVIFGFARHLSSDKKETAVDTASEKPKRKPRRGALSDYLNRSMIASLILLLRRLIKALHLDVNLSGRYGFEEPDITAITTLLIGFLGGSAINLKPDYSRGILDIRGYVRGRVIVARILVIAVQFLLSKPVRAIWRPNITIKRKRKEIIQYA
ncbi:MAG: hypothetical protein ABRQ26_03885 [Syntrophomonadaceae bacterium]